MAELLLRATRRACWHLSIGCPVALSGTVYVLERVAWAGIGAFVYASILWCPR